MKILPTGNQSISINIEVLNHQRNERALQTNQVRKTASASQLRREAAVVGVLNGGGSSCLDH